MNTSTPPRAITQAHIEYPQGPCACGCYEYLAPQADSPQAEWSCAVCWRTFTAGRQGAAERIPHMLREFIALVQ